MSKIRVLVFPAGEFNSAELCAALSRQVNVDVYGASSIERMGHHLFTRYRNDIPKINDPDFLVEFNRLIHNWEIDVVIPTHDSVVEFLSEHRDSISTTLLLPDSETSDACRDKALTFEIFEEYDFCPQIYNSLPSLPNDPVFVKPRRGQGSVGARLINTESDERASIDWENEVACEFLPGQELTVDCFTDSNGALLGVYPRSRGRVLGGITVSGTTLPATAEITNIAIQINERLDFLGMWFMQIKAAVDGSWKLLEISARCSGTQCLTRARGINLPLLSVYAALKRNVDLFENNIPISMERNFVPMYDFDYKYNSVFLDYDDTVVHGSHVDPEIMSLLYQWKNAGISVTLLTRHEGDIHGHMDKNGISPKLFVEIIHITDGEIPKSRYVTRENSIFLDNSFVERREVKNNIGIPVFDVEGAQVLKTWTN